MLLAVVPGWCDLNAAADGSVTLQDLAEMPIQPCSAGVSPRSHFARAMAAASGELPHWGSWSLLGPGNA